VNPGGADTWQTMNKRWWSVAAALVFAAAMFTGYRIYLDTTTVVVWGAFRVPKSELTLARVDIYQGQDSHAYAIHNPRLVLQIANDVSRMQRLQEMTPTNFPPARSPNDRPVTELTIVTQKYGVCGGSFWSVDTHGHGPVVWQDAGRYCWAVPRSLIRTLQRDIHASGTTKLF